MNNSEMLQERINRAYVLYDSDPRVNGPADYEAFSDAIVAAFTKEEGKVSEQERDALGRLVRQTWVEYCAETGDYKPAHIQPYDTLSEWDKEADRRIGVAVYAYAQARAERAEAALRVLVRSFNSAVLLLEDFSALLTDGSFRMMATMAAPCSAEEYTHRIQKTIASTVKQVRAALPAEGKGEEAKSEQ